MSIGKSSLARAAAVSVPHTTTEPVAAQPTLTAREIEVDSILLTKGTKLPAADEGMLKSVRKHGILEPLTLAQAEDGSVWLVAGARRLAAAKEAGLVTVPAVMVAMAAAEAAAARREIGRFAVTTAPAVSASPEQPTAVGQAMPAWLL